MHIDHAILYAKVRLEHYKEMQNYFGKAEPEHAYYVKNAEMLETLLDELNRLNKELLVAVGRP